MTDRERFLQTERLAVGYNGRIIVKNVEITIKKGQILTLIGPNGSGKSTILKSITRQLKTISGVVRIGGRSLEDVSPREFSRQAAIVLTERPKPELMTCGEVVAVGRYPYTGMLGILSESDKEKIDEALRVVGATDLKNRGFAELSDGQRQRILLARAICQDPQIIVLDEPTSFLDVRYELELLTILRAMAEEKRIAVILSMHDLNMAQKVSDLILCVKDETVAYFGPPREIFQRERINALYDLKSGSYNPVFGSFEMERTPGAPRVFVIAGGGTGIDEYRALQKKRIPFVTGILHENDIDYQVARDLAAEVIAVPAFERIGETAYAGALPWLRSCTAVIHCLRGYGEMNVKNRDLFEAAKAAGIKIVTGADALSPPSF